MTVDLIPHPCTKRFLYNSDATSNFIFYILILESKREESNCSEERRDNGSQRGSRALPTMSQAHLKGEQGMDLRRVQRDVRIYWAVIRDKLIQE